MPGFADSFWSSDYAAGLGVLFEKLQQGVIENHQILTIAKMRADAEELYGARLGDIVPAVDKMTGGFARDDGATMRKAYEGIRNEMGEASGSHRKIASNIRELVVNPFGRWCDAHAARMQTTQDDLQARIKAHDKQAEIARKLRSQYFNKCRQVEDLEEENKLAFQDPQPEVGPKRKDVPEVKVTESDDVEDEEPVELGDEMYQPEEAKKILKHMLENIKLAEAKVPILGTYQNVSTGADTVEYIQKHMNATTVSYAERIGQDLVTNGFLRLIGNVGNLFANSSRMKYQWRSKAFQMSGVPERKKPLERASTQVSGSDMIDSPVIGAVGDYLAGWNPLNNPHPNETPSERLHREAKEADDRYKAAVRKLDLLRCTLEEAMMDSLKYLERCELDRLKAIKTVILDFSGTISNVIPTLQSTIDNMMLYQETVQPSADIRYLLDNYRTGTFLPRAHVYENYYNSADDQTFGVDLEARARADRKRVPIIVTTLLTYLDNHYPDLEGDEARRGVWLVDVPLAATHHLRNAINNGQPIPHQLLDQYEIPIIASVLKLYLLELPDSLVSSRVYEIIKTIYSTQTGESDSSARISVIQNTLGQLRLANIATLDALTTHFSRLIELTSADETYISALASTLAPCTLRPRTESSLTTHERYSYRLVRDLLAYKEEIFGELKRASTMTHSASTAAGRSRPVDSTNERDRRAKMEARAQAIVSKSRASSPQPLAGRSHRRDRSTGGAATRFPIQTSPPTSASAERKGIRQSLEVPGVGAAVEGGQNASDTDGSKKPAESTTNGPPPQQHIAATDGPAVTAAAAAEHVSNDASGGEKRSSVGPAVGTSSSGGKVQRRIQVGNSARLSQTAKRNSLHGVPVEEVQHVETPPRPVGVTLSDKPVDD